MVINHLFNKDKYCFLCLNSRYLLILLCAEGLFEISLFGTYVINFNHVFKPQILINVMECGATTRLCHIYNRDNYCVSQNLDTSHNNFYTYTLIQ